MQWPRRLSSRGQQPLHADRQLQDAEKLLLEYKARCTGLEDQLEACQQQDAHRQAEMQVSGNYVLHPVPSRIIASVPEGVDAEGVDVEGGHASHLLQRCVLREYGR
jgi:hypothetical protein